MQKGDFIKIDYIGRIASTGEIFDLTDKSVAEKEGIYNPKQRYGPVLVIIGSGMVVPGVEKVLMGMKPGEEKEFDVKQEEGFGRRDPRLIKIISLQKFYSQKINPVPGAYVNIDGRNARIQSVSGGRVRVDFNSPLAGKDLHYKVRVIEKITGPSKMAMALAEYYGIDAHASFSEGTLTIETRDKFPEQIKSILSTQIKKWIKDVKNIDYTIRSSKKSPDVSAKEKKEK